MKEDPGFFIRHVGKTCPFRQTTRFINGIPTTSHDQCTWDRCAAYTRAKNPDGNGVFWYCSRLFTFTDANELQAQYLLERGEIND